MLIDVSVIVPVYNTAKYLPQCLDSILKQKGLNLEIICVDDASTDNSKFILSNYKLKHPENIKVITNLKNMGYGYSMNIGIEAATTPITCCVDSDDYLIEGTLYDVCNQLKCTQADFLQMKQCLFMDANNQYRIYDFLEYRHFDLRKDSQFSIVICPWLKIYKSTFVKKFKFTESPGASYQDVSFGGNICFQAKTITVYNKPIYCYRHRREGSSSTYSSMISKAVFVRYEYIKFLHEVQSYDVDMIKVMYSVFDAIYEQSKAYFAFNIPVSPLLIQLMSDIYSKYNSIINSDDALQSHMLTLYRYMTTKK